MPLGIPRVFELNWALLKQLHRDWIHRVVDNNWQQIHGLKRVLEIANQLWQSTRMHDGLKMAEFWILLIDQNQLRWDFSTANQWIENEYIDYVIMIALMAELRSLFKEGCIRRCYASRMFRFWGMFVFKNLQSTNLAPGSSTRAWLVASCLYLRRFTYARCHRRKTWEVIEVFDWFRLISIVRWGKAADQAWCDTMQSFSTRWSLGLIGQKVRANGSK